MIEIVIPEKEIYNEENNTFFNIKETKLQLEHSLISVRKWESKWHKSFLETDEKTLSEITDYIKCMTINRGVDPIIYQFISAEDVKKIVDYIKDSMTATWFTENEMTKQPSMKREVITAEIIYYWMIALNIPMECEKWHLNQLLTLIKVVGIKSSGPQKLNRKEAAEMRRRANRERRAKYKSKG